MTRHSMSCFTALLLLLASDSVIVAQPSLRLASEPAAAEFVAEDLHNFVSVFERLSDEGDSLHVLQTSYFDKGSVGLQTFVARQSFTAKALLDVIRKSPDDFDSIAALPSQLARLDPELRKAFGQLQRLYPSTVFPPTYFFVGPLGRRRRGFGSRTAHLAAQGRPPPAARDARARALSAGDGTGRRAVSFDLRSEQESPGPLDTRGNR